MPMADSYLGPRLKLTVKVHTTKAIIGKAVKIKASIVASQAFSRPATKWVNNRRIKPATIIATINAEI